VKGAPRTAALDPTALLTAGILGAVDNVLGTFDQIVIPHATLGWLFEERQRIQFHQPSKIAAAREVRRLLEAGALQKFEPTVALDNDLAAEIGDALAALFTEAEANTGEEHRQRLVVRSAPVYRTASLMEEEADLGRHESYLCSCLDLVSALTRQGQLTQSEEKRARAYLTLREKPWPSSQSIESGAILYLDELSVVYLQELGLLPKLNAAGFTSMIAYNELEKGEFFVKYETLAGRATDIIEDIRRAVSAGIANGKVVLAKSSIGVDGVRPHPTLELHDAAALVDIVVIDDRYFNQLSEASGPFGSKPIWTTFDVLTAQNHDASQQQQEYLTNMRRAGLALVPVKAAELAVLVEQAPVYDGVLTETAELKAVRETLLLVRMSAGLQLSNEGFWLDNVFIAFIETIKSQWRPDIDELIARARSNWLLEQIDIRQWRQQNKVEGRPEAGEIAYSFQILSLAFFNSAAPRPVKLKYWEWLDETLLKRIQDSHRELYGLIVRQARTTIDDACERSP
jgi:hypothetical protein